MIRHDAVKNRKSSNALIIADCKGRDNPMICIKLLLVFVEAIID